MLDTPLILSTQILPLWASTMALQMASPRPVPSVLPSLPDGAVENLSNMVSIFFSGIPIPWSLIETVADSIEAMGTLITLSLFERVVF